MRHRLHITRQDIDAALRHGGHRHHHGHHAHRDPSKGGSAGSHIVQSIEVLGASFGMGVAKGKVGIDKFQSLLGPVPLDAALFVAMQLGGFMAGGRPIADHLHNLGDGFGAGYVHQMGAMVGASWAGTTPATPAAAGIAGALGRGNRPLTEAELAAMAQMRRR